MTGLILAPATDRNAAYDNFRKTMLDGVSNELYDEYTDVDLESPARVWGVTSSLEATWDSVDNGDWGLFYTRENEYQYAAQVIGKEHNHELGNEIRDNLLEDVEDDRNWDFLLFFHKPISISVSGHHVANLLNYGNYYPVRFVRVKDERLESIESKYDGIEGFIDAIRE